MQVHQLFFAPLPKYARAYAFIKKSSKQTIVAPADFQIQFGANNKKSASQISGMPILVTPTESLFYGKLQ